MIDIETIASRIVAAAMKVHTVLGPGLLESAYQKCMQYELQKDGSKFNVKRRCRSFMKIYPLTLAIEST